MTDDAPRTVDVPPALADAFLVAPELAERWKALSSSEQEAHARSVEGARTDRARDRRVAKVIDALS